MTIVATSAAKELEAGTPSPHKLISLLMQGMLERVSQAKGYCEQGDKHEEEILLAKIVAIINGLRESLNFDQGGEIAVNLDSLYEYMIAIIGDADSSERKKVALDEIEKLMTQVKSGWDAVDEEAAA